MADEQGYYDLMIQLEEIAKKVQEPEPRRRILVAMAEPVVEEAKRITRKGGSVFKDPTGNLSEHIATKWDKEDSDKIRIGWSGKGYYGKFWELGFFHKKNKRFYKKPHLRPAYEAKKSEVAKAAQEQLRKELENI